MPELPEVETTRRGLQRRLRGLRVTDVIVRERRLRYRVTPGLRGKLAGRRVAKIARRGKYLLFYLDDGCLLCHLGMSGSFRIAGGGQAAGSHDHLDIVFGGGKILRFRDPRKFGAVLWVGGEPLRHKLLAGLGPEPLGAGFGGDYLYEQSRGRSAPVKHFIMDSRVVVGVGNIYANESLFIAGIHPARRAGRVSRQRYQELAAAIRRVLQRAIRKGGTTLRDFVKEDGQPGYFGQTLTVYQRGGEACPACGGVIRSRVLGQRSTFYCPRCQR